GERGVVLASIETPLVQLGGITSYEWNRDSFDPESPTIMAWPLNNHWEVNFKSSQDGEIPVSYRLTTFAGETDIAAATRFAAEQAVAPIVLRDRERNGPETGRFLSVPEDAPVLVTAKPAERADAIVVRVQNLSNRAQSVPLDLLSGKVREARR